MNSLGSLISNLREKKNNEMKINICQIVPIPTSHEINAKIKDCKEHLIRWGEINGLEVVQTPSALTLGDGGVDDLFWH